MTLADACPENWRPHLLDTLNGDVGRHIQAQLNAESTGGYVYFPPAGTLFSALEGLDPSSVRVVILGQDPYHGRDQATGRAFEVMNGMPMPPSLRNIRKLLECDVGVIPGDRFELGCWCNQGVLLLNTALTVRANSPGSHQHIGWQAVTDQIIKIVVEQPEPTVFMLWGAHAQKKAALVKGAQNQVLSAPHPSPLSAYRGFFSCRHFSKANEWLIKHHESAIDWKCAC